MKQKLAIGVVLCSLIFCSYSLAANEDIYWPGFRGPLNTGVAPDANPPVSWGESENIKWKVEVVGEGSSSPVVWGEKLFYLTAVQAVTGGDGKTPKPQKFDVVCVDRSNGKVLWQKTVKEETPHEGHHKDGSFASYSPVTDGKLLWASFGSRGLYCLDLDGNVKWSNDLPKMEIRAGFGEGSSPAIAGDAVVVVTDHEGQSYIYAFDKLSGELLWKKERDERTSWATPIAVSVGGQEQIITNAANFVRAYDLKTGEVVWQCSGQTENVIPTPIAANGKVYCTSGFRGSALQAIELGRTGDLTGTGAIGWHVDEATPYVPSPILIKDKIYVCSGNKAIISCYQSDDGKPNYMKQSLDGPNGIYASPVGVSDRVYFAGRNGVTVVIKVSDSFEVLATNTLDDGFDATPAIVGDEIYLKGNKNLYCIAKK